MRGLLDFLVAAVAFILGGHLAEMKWRRKK